MTLGEPLNLVVLIHAHLEPSPTMLVTKTNTCIHPKSDLLRQAMGIFNKLSGKFNYKFSYNGIWKCPWKLSLSLFLNIRIGEGILQFLAD